MSCCSLMLMMFASAYVFTYTFLYRKAEAEADWYLQSDTYCSKAGSEAIINDGSQGFGVTREQCIRMCNDLKECRMYTYGVWMKGSTIRMLGGHKGEVRCQLYSWCDIKSFKGMTLYWKPQASHWSHSQPLSDFHRFDAILSPLNIIAFLVPAAANTCVTAFRSAQMIGATTVCLSAAATVASTKSDHVGNLWQDELIKLVPAVKEAWVSGALPNAATTTWLIILFQLLNVLAIAFQPSREMGSNEPLRVETPSRAPTPTRCITYKFEMEGLPNYWCGSGIIHKAGHWRLQPPDAKTCEALAQMLYVPDASQLGKGRDVKEYHREYTELGFYTAWRVEYPDKYFEYSSRRTTVANHVKSLEDSGFSFRPTDVQLPGAGSMPAEMKSDANEVYLLSGTKPEFLLAILNQGLSLKLSALTGAFGAGIYLAESAAKIDQYTAPDHSYDHDGLAELHARLFQDSWLPHPDEDLFYCLVVRTTLGWGLRTIDGLTDADDDDAALFHNPENRELKIIPGSSPPSRYMSLTAEKGKALERFREFVVFNDSQCYVEYVIAYKRV